MKINNFFNEQFGDVLVILDNDNKCWFMGKQIARILGYNYPKNAIRDNVDDNDKVYLSYKEIKYLLGFLKGEHYSPLKISKYGAVFINEVGVYSLIFGSRLESAKKFKRWVYEDVLVNIRETGMYIEPEHNLVRFVSKEIRDSEESLINKFIKYMKDYNYDVDKNKVYGLISSLANKCSKIENGKRDEAPDENLMILILVENKISQIINYYMDKETKPDEIFKILYKTIEDYSNNIHNLIKQNKLLLINNNKNVIIYNGIKKLKIRIRPKK